MDASPKLLVVDDESCIRMVLMQSLKIAGFEVTVAANGLEALEMLPTLRPALVIVDVNMPGLNGFDTVERMRQMKHVQPVLMLTSYDGIDERVRGFSVGADDYLTKPFHQRELVARVRALLRRAVRPVVPVEAPSTLAPAAVAGSRVLRFGELTVDLSAKQADRAGVPLALTRTEFSLLECLASQRGRAVSREHLLAAVWGYDAGSNTRTVETHIWRLRKKLGENGETPWLRTLSGQGYLMEPEAMLTAV